MSDCRIPMPSYKAPIHTREQDELRVTAHFKDGLHPQDFVANRDTPSGTRVLDYLESDGERYERVRECHVMSEYSYYDHTIPSGITTIARIVAANFTTRFRNTARTAAHA